nr:hypothetical protein [Tanacetum cinerariifolium]
MMEAYTERMNQQREQEALLAAQREQELREQEQAAQRKQELQKHEVKNIVEQPTKCRIQSPHNFRIIHKKSSISLNNTSQISSVIANTPDLPTEEPDNSLSMGDEHLSTILETKSDEVIKSSVENLGPIPSKSKVTSDNENDDDKSLSNEDVPMIYSNSVFDNGEIISTKIDPHYYNAESNLIKSLLNRDTLIDSSPKFDYLLEEFSGKLAHINPISSRIKEADFHLEEEIHLVENFFDFQIEEIDLFLATNDSMPPGIENDDYDSEGDIHFLEELLSDDPFSLPENESSNFDHHDDPSFSCPPPKPPDVKIFSDFEPDTSVLTAKVVEDISEHYVLMPKVLPTQPTLCLNIDTLLPFSSENEDKVFKPGILSYLLVSHRDKITFDFSENPMMMYGEDIPLLDVPYLHFCPP